MSEAREKTKPCGVPYCPLVDESRFFAEGQATLIESGLTTSAIFPFAGKVVQVWCRGRVARGLPLDPRVCREVLNRVADGLAKANQRYAYLQHNLKRELDTCTTEVHRSRSEALADMAGSAGF